MHKITQILLGSALFSGALIGLLSAGGAHATPLEPDPAPFAIEDFEAGFCDRAALIEGVSHRLPETDWMDPMVALPSLWLKRDVFAYQARFGKKIFEGWLVCQSSNTDRHRIDLVVNGQLWSVLDYFDRYELVQQFGIGSDRADVRSRSGYNLRVFNRQGRSLGSYTCDAPSFGHPVLPAASPDTAPHRPNCQVTLNDANNGLGLRNRLAN